MTNSPEERLQLTTPEYQAAVGELYTAASSVMDANPDFVAKHERWGTYTDITLQLRSETGEIIVLEKTLEKPLSKDPDWLSVTPRIGKIIRVGVSNQYLHDYINKDGLIIDRMQYCYIKPGEIDASDAVEDELGLEDIERLTDEIKVWAPIEQVQTKRSRIAKAISFVANRM